MNRPHDPLRGMDPTKPFYLAVTPEWNDGSIGEPEGSGYEGVFDTPDEAVACLREVNDGYALDGYVYHCVPVAKVWRGKIRVTKLASADTLPKGRDAKQGSVRSKGSAVPKADAQ